MMMVVVVRSSYHAMWQLQLKGLDMRLREAKIEVVVDDENDDNGVVGDYLTRPCGSCS